jgi:hypothetical protein
VLPGKAVNPVHVVTEQPVTISGTLEETLWNPDQAAAGAGVTKTVLAVWVNRGYLARANAKSARTPLYRASDVLATEHQVRMRRGTNQWTAAA